MKKNIVFILLAPLLFITSSIGGSKLPFGERAIAYYMKESAIRHKIDIKMLYTLASIESDFKPLSIAIETTRSKAEVLKRLRSRDIKVRTGITYHSKRALVSLYPKSYDTAVLIINKLEELGFCFDVGLFQINTVNFELSEVKRMLLPKENIEKAAIHLESCIKQFKNKIHQIECYNRGGGNLRKMLRKKKYYYPYWKRYRKHYRSYFGEYP